MEKCDANTVIRVVQTEERVKGRQAFLKGRSKSLGRPGMGCAFNVFFQGNNLETYFSDLRKIITFFLRTLKADQEIVKNDGILKQKLTIKQREYQIRACLLSISIRWLFF